MFEQLHIFFVGAGSLSEAMIKGLSQTGLVTPGQMMISNRRQAQRLGDLQQRYGVRVSQERDGDLQQAHMIVLATKPADALGALRAIAPALRPHHLLVSCAAGIETRTLEDCVEHNIPVVRAMPNTSCAVLESATAICRGRWASDEQVELARRLFSAIGNCVLVDEGQMDAVTGLSGSGPAYVYYIVEALMEAGLACGLPEETSRTLLLQTITGAAKMLAETGQHPQELRRQVTSPQGTTQAGISVLNAHHVQQVFVETVVRATARAKELGQQAQIG